MYQCENGSSYIMSKACAAAVRISGCDTCDNCPFGDCIYSLIPTERNLVMSAPIVRRAFELQDKHKPVHDIVSDIGIAYHRVRYWLANRNTIEQKLEVYAVK